MGASLFVGISLTWIMSFYHFLLIAHLSSFKVSQHLLSSQWLLLIFIVAPLISIFVNSIGMILAICIQKLNTAANLGILILSPFFGLLLLVNFGKIVLEINLLMKLSALLFFLGIGTFITAKRLLNRESLILRY
jgi:hypothetical protein